MKNKILLSLVCGLLIVGLATGCDNSKTNDNGKTADDNSTSSNNNSASTKELIYNSTDAFDYSEVDGGIIITYFKNYDYTEYDKIYIPSEIDGKKVIGIGALKNIDTYYGKVFSAIFGNCEVIIPDTVTYIGGKAFQDAKGLVKLSGGKNVKTIGEYAFMNCENLQEITFINNVTNVSDNAFAGCTKWTGNR